MAAKKVPVRMCIGCGEMIEKRQLVRIVKNKEGEISVDLTGKAQGRGAYICRKVECLKKAEKSKRLNKAFSMNIDEEIYKTLESEIS